MSFNKKRNMMKQSLRLGAFFALIAFCMHAFAAQSFTERIKEWIPKDPRTSLNPVDAQIPSAAKSSPFSLPSLKTPQSVSNAMQRLVQAFKLLSPKTLALIIKTQKEKYDANSRAFAQNPNWKNRAALASNVLAIAAATTALGLEAGAVAGAGYAIGAKGMDIRKRYQSRKARREQEEGIVLQLPTG
jgi:Mrp family chromosome partitioning ATPase